MRLPFHLIPKVFVWYFDDFNLLKSGLTHSRNALPFHLRLTLSQTSPTVCGYDVRVGDDKMIHLKGLG